MTASADDRLAIMDQIYRYCRSVDRLDVPLGHAVFHPEATARFPDFEGTGRGWIDYICEQHRKFLHHSHQVTNLIIDVDAERAGSESYVLATLRSSEGEKVIQRQFWARYVDSWSRRNGYWAIDARECLVDFASIEEVRALGEFTRARRDPTDPSYSVLKGRP